jgi:hypothetical protein
MIPIVIQIFSVLQELNGMEICVKCFRFTTVLQHLYSVKHNYHVFLHAQIHFVILLLNVQEH